MESLRILRSANVHSVGLLAEDSWEYPFLDPKQDAEPPEFTVDHVLVTNVYAPLEKQTNFDAIVAMDEAPQTSITVDGKNYVDVYQSSKSKKGLVYIAVFMPAK